MEFCLFPHATTSTPAISESQEDSPGEAGHSPTSTVRRGIFEPVFSSMEVKAELPVRCESLIKENKRNFKIGKQKSITISTTTFIHIYFVFTEYSM